jgi:hypothetical protein
MAVACDAATNQMLPIVADKTEAAIERVLDHNQRPTVKNRSASPAHPDINKQDLYEHDYHHSSASIVNDCDADVVLLEDNMSEATSDEWAWETDFDNGVD